MDKRTNTSDKEWKEIMNAPPSHYTEHKTYKKTFKIQQIYILSKNIPNRSKSNKRCIRALEGGNLGTYTKNPKNHKKTKNSKYMKRYENI